MANDFVNQIKTKDGELYDIQDKRLDEVESGTIVDALGLNADGELVKGAVSGGTKLYLHTLSGRGISVTWVNSSNVAKNIDMPFGCRKASGSPLEGLSEVIYIYNIGGVKYATGYKYITVGETTNVLQYMSSVDITSFFTEAEDTVTEL